MKLLGLFQKIRNSIVQISTDDPTISPAQDENFIRLVQLMNKDAGFRVMLLKIIELDRFNRNSMLNTIIHKQKLQGTSEEHLQVLKFLTDDLICEKIKSLLKSTSKSGVTSELGK